MHPEAQVSIEEGRSFERNLPPQPDPELVGESDSSSDSEGEDEADEAAQADDDEAEEAEFVESVCAPKMFAGSSRIRCTRPSCFKQLGVSILREFCRIIVRRILTNSHILCDGSSIDWRIFTHSSLFNFRLIFRCKGFQPPPQWQVRRS